MWGAVGIDIMETDEECPSSDHRACLGDFEGVEPSIGDLEGGETSMELESPIEGGETSMESLIEGGEPSMESLVGGGKPSIENLVELRVKSEGTLYTCPQCAEVFTEKHQYESHYQLLHEAAALLAPCASANQYSAVLHQPEERSTNNPKTNFYCDQCQKRFSSKGILARHIKRFHTNPRKFNCPHCTLVFTETSSIIAKNKLEIHVLLKHPDEVVLEMEKNSSDPSLVCNHCRRRYPNKETLENHRQRIETQLDIARQKTSTMNEQRRILIDQLLKTRKPLHSLTEQEIDSWMNKLDIVFVRPIHSVKKNGLSYKKYTLANTLFKEILTCLTKEQEERLQLQSDLPDLQTFRRYPSRWTQVLQTLLEELPKGRRTLRCKNRLQNKNCDDNDCQVCSFGKQVKQVNNISEKGPDIKKLRTRVTHWEELPKITKPESHYSQKALMILGSSLTKLEKERNRKNVRPDSHYSQKALSILGNSLTSLEKDKSTRVVQSENHNKQNNTAHKVQISMEKSRQPNQENYLACERCEVIFYSLESHKHHNCIRIEGNPKTTVLSKYMIKVECNDDTDPSLSSITPDQADSSTENEENFVNVKLEPLEEVDVLETKYEPETVAFLKVEPLEEEHEASIKVDNNCSDYEVNFLEINDTVTDTKIVTNNT